MIQKVLENVCLAHGCFWTLSLDQSQRIFVESLITFKDNVYAATIDDLITLQKVVNRRELEILVSESACYSVLQSHALWSHTRLQSLVFLLRCDHFKLDGSVLWQSINSNDD